MDQAAMKEQIDQMARQLCAAVHRNPDCKVLGDRPHKIHVPRQEVYVVPEDALRPLWMFYYEQALHMVSPRLGTPEGFGVPDRICLKSESGVHEFGPVQRTRTDDEYVGCKECGVAAWRCKLK